MKDEHPISQLMKQAAACEPFGQPDDFGFETRLRAALHESETSTADWIARFSFPFSAALLPILIAVAAVIAFQNYGTLPEGVGGFVAHWFSLIPTGT